MKTEAERITAEYERRQRELPADFYSLTRPANLFFRHGQQRALLWALTRSGMVPLAERRVVEIGCGMGQWLGIFEDFGAQRQNMAAIELEQARGQKAIDRFPGADIRIGDASRLPWDDGQFDIVFQSMVFTSILDDAMKASVAREMLRVLRPGGVVIWYDFQFNNPNNPAVRKIRRPELERLFPGCRLALRRVTLAPPLARRIVPHCWSLAAALEKLRLLNTHYMGVIQRSG